MGMFDYIKCEVQLPGYSFITDEEFQTKSLDNCMDHYVLTKNGELYRDVWEYEWVENKELPIGGSFKKIEGTYRRHYLTDLHGDIIFYSDTLIDGKRYDYFARFTEGKLSRMWCKEWDRW